MLYRQDISGVLAETIGERGVKPRQLDETLVRADAALDTLRQWHREDSLPLLWLPGRRDDLDEWLDDLDDWLEDRPDDLDHRLENLHPWLDDAGDCVGHDEITRGRRKHAGGQNL